MPFPRPSAWALTGVLLLSSTFTAVGGVSAANTGPSQIQIADPNAVCSSGEKPTGWKDDLRPPTTIRVLRSNGPNKGHVETVNFWDYVAVVVRAEYSSGQDKPPVWMQVGAITVKEYGWYKTLFWGGGRVSFTDPATGQVTSTECYDVKDTTADQIYKPQQTGSDGTVYPGNVPTAPIYRAMAQTWHMTMRKWNAVKNVSRLFLSGYRSGNNVACGADSTGFKIYQKSLYDCVKKNLTLEETLRKYFDPVLLVNTRESDVRGDGGGWWGDATTLAANGGSTSWTVYPGKADGFGSAASGTFNVAFGSIVDNGKGYGVGNVDLPSANASANDERMFADIVMVTSNAVFVARSTGNGFADLVATSFAGGASKALFGDFDGDLMMDVGLLRSAGGASSLWVMKAKGDDTFADPVLTWTGPDVTGWAFVAAGDVNGDGKADLIGRDEAGDFQTAVSPASCSPIGAVATSCPTGSVGGAALGALKLALPDPGGLNSAKLVVGDYDRDGRDDVMGLVGDTGTVFAMRAQSDGSGTFTDKNVLFSSNSLDLTNAQPLALNVDPDGMADLAVVQSGSIKWLRTIERSATPAEMVLSSDFPYIGQDTTPPSTPTLRATAASGLQISLNWNVSTDNSGGTVSYRVYRDGKPIGSQQTALTYVDHPAAGRHGYSVKAYDGSGNISTSPMVWIKAVN